MPNMTAKTYTRDVKSRKGVIRMDPDCAICRAPASLACDCEAKGLENAIKQAEDRMMKSIYGDIRFVSHQPPSFTGVEAMLTMFIQSSWVRAHAQDYILEYFRQLTERRKTAHSAHVDSINAHAFYHYNAPPHPAQLADAQAALKRGIDEDWQASVQRYPEVLEYYFGLVELTLPADDEPAVKQPPLGALSRKAHRRSTVGAPAGPPPIAATSYYDREALPPRTPPPMDRMERRTPGPGPAPRERRPPAYFRPQSMPHPAASHYAPY
ncbi:hypothetical protein S7711_00361 [Stachybotrys chartarum IBT 7711]|uniref:Uncharacterized protein n=1 Tax=Stachybotrys chartarum (strain CBS 109288 / IBT 7711) TaxID=1280523 RepID=A0A084B9H5_STACB|nr:hypothetical protein S7711_00361 [Stachybotrys chartarum IBT 7711]KFA55520.1 hypothetical protein S40293_02022 [Stachybotrys chartarum IBT 40293]KFA75793.1 hypothetical protein S40288_07780 [Stachybotrys chartarum IBT 40288]